MPTIECLIIQGDRLLLTRQEDDVKDGILQPISGRVEPGEIPLHACNRVVLKETGFKLSSSCAAVILNEEAHEDVGYRLVFVAELAASSVIDDQSGSNLEWVPVSQLDSNAELSSLNKALLPKVLATAAPLAVVLAEQADGSRAVQEASPIDPARLSPFVFAATD